MGKGDRRSGQARKNRQKESIGFDLAPVPKKQPNGRKRRASQSIGQDARKVVADRRARTSGRKAREIISDQMYGTGLGTALASSLPRDDATRAYQAWLDCASAYYSFCYHVLDINPAPAFLRLPVNPEFGGGSSAYSNPEEAARCARDKWDRWCDIIRQSLGESPSLIVDSFWREDEYWWCPLSRKVTGKGRQMIGNLRIIGQEADNL